MNQYGISTASWAEITWTIACAIGAVVCFVLLREANGDMRWLRDNGHNGERRLLALNVLVSEGVQAATLTLLAFVGVWAMFTPSSHASGKPTTLSIVTSIVFVLVAIAMTANALLRRWWNDEYVRRRSRRNQAAGAAAAPITVVVDTTDIDSLEITTKAVEADADAP